jgi:hypothetical protein
VLYVLQQFLQQLAKQTIWTNISVLMVLCPTVPMLITLLISILIIIVVATILVVIVVPVVFYPTFIVLQSLYVNIVIILIFILILVLFFTGAILTAARVISGVIWIIACNILYRLILFSIIWFWHLSNHRWNHNIPVRVDLQKNPTYNRGCSSASSS